MLSPYGVADVKQGLNQAPNGDLMAEASNHDDKQRANEKHINHTSGQDTLEGRELMNRFDQLWIMVNHFAVPKHCTRIN